MHTVLADGRIEIVNRMCDTFHLDIRSDIRKGLTTPQKYIPSKYFYDSRGSSLFELICSLPEYYQTRTELAILRDAAPSIMAGFGGGYLIELGSGAHWKVRALLDATPCPQDICYIPIDVSESALSEASQELLVIYPRLKILGMVADFTMHIRDFPESRKRLFVFFGSTIGNFDEKKRAGLLSNVAHSMGPEDRFLVGIDMIKPKAILERAYNDSKGITAEFNKNVLKVLNRELEADFQVDHFDHLAFFDQDKERVEMHLRANRKVSAYMRKLDLNVTIEKDETIHTEICTKFTRESANQMARDAGLEIGRWFADPRGWFSLVELVHA